MTANLRALDWRFLLPSPPGGRFARMAIVGGDPAIVALARECGLADVIEGDVPASAPADAVVCLAGAGTPIETACAALAPGGVLYVELDRRQRPGNTLRRLRRLGLRPAGVYWPHPSFVQPEAYLPTDVPQGVAWYFRNVFVITTIRARALVGPARAASFLGSRALRSIAPRLAVVAVVGEQKTAPSLLAADGIPADARQHDARPVVLMGGGEWSRVALVPFAPVRRAPLAVVKTWRTGGRELLIETEQDGQRRVRRLAGPALQEAVPEPLGIVRWGALQASVETCARGEWLMARRHRRRRVSAHEHELRLVAEWLTAFNERARVERGPWGEADVETWVAAPAARYSEVFGPRDHEEALFSHVEARARALVGAQLPFVWCHTDLSELNVYCGESSISVIDWEGLGPGLPSSDLLYYLPRWTFRARRLTREETFEAFRELFVSTAPRDRAVVAARAALDAYATRLDLDERFLPVLVTTEWIRRAVGRHGRMFPDGVEPERTRTANRFARYVEILSAHVPELFDRPYRWSTS